MAPAAKHGSSSSGGKPKAALTGLANVVAKQLKDPKVRKQVIDQGLAIAAQAQTWRSERRPREAHERTNPLGGRFGQPKLERRVEHLKDLGPRPRDPTRPELIGELEPVSTTLREIDTARAIANGLPLMKCKKAHHQIDQALDHLEQTIFQASMPKLT